MDVLDRASHYCKSVPAMNFIKLLLWFRRWSGKPSEPQFIVPFNLNSAFPNLNPFLDLFYTYEHKSFKEDAERDIKPIHHDRSRGIQARRKRFEINTEILRNKFN